MEPPQPSTLIPLADEFSAPTGLLSLDLLENEYGDGGFDSEMEYAEGMFDIQNANTDRNGTIGRMKDRFSHAREIPLYRSVHRQHDFLLEYLPHLW